jgi:hypothetical protein
VAGFGLPNFGQLTEAFRKAQQIQQDAQKLQEDLDAMEIEGSSSDGGNGCVRSPQERLRNLHQHDAGTDG